MKRTIAVIDAETDPFKRGRIPSPFIWGFFDGDEYIEFTDLSAMPDHLSREGLRDISELVPFLEDRHIVVYAHNGGKFDYHFLLPYLNPYSEIMIINGRLARFNIGLCEFRDSFNIMPVPLKAWEKDDFDYQILEKETRYIPKNWAAIREYLQSDCENLYSMVTAFIDRFGLRLTQAGASMKLWEKIYNRKAPRSDQSFYDMFSTYYYGGRVQCFEHGEINRNVKLVDINSAYPFAMLERHPISLEYISTTRVNKNDPIYGPAFYDVYGIVKGAFPSRGEDKKLYFPDDNNPREYHVTGWELQAAIDTGAIRNYEILRRITFMEEISFDEFILPLYQERLEAKAAGDEKTSLLVKLAMNGLYGKFGANPDGYKKYAIFDPDYMSHIEDEEYEFAGMIGPWALGEQSLDDEERRYYNVATSASITGYVRAYLWRAICAAEGVLYCDTDSILCEGIGDITIGKNLGHWSLDGEFDRALIAGRKLYALRYKGSQDYKVRAKGLKLSADEVEKLCRGESVLFEPENPTFSIRKAPFFNNRKARATF